MDEIRSWWQVPSIAHYCSLFRTAFNLTDFEIEDLEDALLIAGGDEDSRFLADLHARLLRGLFSKKAEINADNFEVYLSEVLKVRYVEDLKKDNPLELTRYRYLSTWEKVEILHGLCDWRLDVADVQDLTKGMEAEVLRVEPLGRDAQQNTYWYFYGTRLYKESNIVMKDNGKKKQKKSQIKKKKGKKRKRKKRLSDSESSLTNSSDSDWNSDREFLPNDDECGGDYETETDYDENSVPKKWSLVCSTLDEWSSLADSFKNSKNKNEKLLYQTLTVDFLTEISEMLENKEKVFRKKLLMEMAPRRSSDRIAIKAQQKEDEDKQAEIDRQLEKERMAEIRKQEAEEREKERQIMNEKRQRERAERARLREERQWMYANGEEVPEEFLQSYHEGDHVGRSQGNEEDDDDDDEDDSKLDQLDKAFAGDIDMFTGMYKVLDAMKSHEDGWPFLEPVEDSYAPHYSEIITSPMDLSTIEKKIDDKTYKGLKEFISDIKLMFNNCLEYNGEESSYTQMGRTLESVFNRSMKKHFPDDENQSSDEDFEEELTEQELRKIQNKQTDSADSASSGPEDDEDASDSTKQRNVMQTHHLQDPNMMARHFAGMIPMQGGRPMHPMPYPPQSMPYVNQMQQYYAAARMYAGHPAFARFNMNDMVRGPRGQMYPQMMGMPHPGMPMGPRQYPRQEIPRPGPPPVATKGEPSPSHWTGSGMQAIRGHGYPPHTMTSSSPWRPASGQQMMGNWYQANGMIGGARVPYQATENGINLPPQSAPTTNYPEKKPTIDDGGNDNNDNKSNEEKPGLPTEKDLRYPFIMAQRKQPPPTPGSNPPPQAPNTEDAPTTGTPGTTPSSDEVVTEEGKTFTNLDSARNSSAEKRANPYSVSSIIAKEQAPAAKEERLKFSTLLQEMSRGRANDQEAQVMDLSSGNNIGPPVPQGSASGGGGDPRAYYGGYAAPKPAANTQLGPTGGQRAPGVTEMRAAQPPQLNNPRGFDARALYSYQEDIKRQHMQYIMQQQQQQQQQQQMQKTAFHPMLRQNMPRGMVAGYAGQAGIRATNMDHYQNGDNPSPLDELTNKKPRVS